MNNYEQGEAKRQNCEIRPADPEGLRWRWERNIDQHRDKVRWRAWRDEYLDINASGRGKTYLAWCNGEPVGEGTLLFSPECSAVSGRLQLADGRKIANVNALRMEEKQENRGNMSALVRRMEQDAAKMGIETLTIGVSASETRNLGIYLHWGYRQLVLHEVEDDDLVLYYAKQIGPKE